MTDRPALLELSGRARVLGDSVNTDYIIASSRKKATLDPAALKQWLLEAVDPAFAASVEPGDILVAGDDFGGGSAMEVAVTVVQAAGIRAVVARSFARSYFRNAVNNGLLPLEADTSDIREGDRLRLLVTPPRALIMLDGDRRTIEARPLPDFVLHILATGGLVPYLRGRSRFPGTAE